VMRDWRNSPLFLCFFLYLILTCPSFGTVVDISVTETSAEHDASENKGREDRKESEQKRERGVNRGRWEGREVRREEEADRRTNREADMRVKNDR
jgi:hypothetical protein